MSSDPRLGATLGPYRIESLLGRGGMGRVYLAEHLHLGRKVALKILPPELAEEDPTFRDRFLRETRLAASLDHPHIVPVYDAGEVEGQLYLAMRYVSGTDLGKVLAAKGPLDPDRVLRILSQTADALDHAHAEGLIHRDVKPSNILLSPFKGNLEHTFLTDFGLARHLSSTTRYTQTGLWVGTLHYSAPEQFMGAGTGPSTDVYALGCVAYECLTGGVVFPKAIEAAVMLAHLQEPPPRASEARPELPEAVNEVLARALAKEPEGRFATAGEVVDALREAVDRPVSGTRSPDTAPSPAPEPPNQETVRRPREPIAGPRPVPHPPPSPPEPVGKPARGPSRPRLVIIGALLAVLGGIAGIPGAFINLSSGDDEFAVILAFSLGLATLGGLIPVPRGAVMRRAIAGSVVALAIFLVISIGLFLAEG